MSRPKSGAARAANLAAHLRYVRERRGLTQAQLARLCGLPRTTVGELETGESNPTLNVLRATRWRPGRSRRTPLASGARTHRLAFGRR